MLSLGARCSGMRMGTLELRTGEVRAGEARIGKLIDSLEPSGFKTQLQNAWAHEQKGEFRTAAAAWRTALQSIPRLLPPTVRPVLEHATAQVAANNAALGDFLADQLSSLRHGAGPAELARFDRCVDTLLQRRRVYRPSPSFLYVPNLPAYEFYDRAHFPWLERLEAASADIRAELIEVLADGPETLEPYIEVDGTPQPQWAELNRSRRWGVFFLWKGGEAVVENQARCPKTMAALADWPRCELEGTGPTAVFSILDAKTRIPPHVGVNNARLIVHLPLIVPPGCGFRVGAETRDWRPGEAFVFDDTIEHEAWNDSDAPRAVLILDTWNPFLSEAERELVTALTAGVAEYYGELPLYAQGGTG